MQKQQNNLLMLLDTKIFSQNISFFIYFYESISRRIKNENINLEEHLTSSYGEEYWMSVTVSYYGTIRTVKRLVLLDREANNIEEVKLLVYLQYHEIEDHMRQIEKIERRKLLDDNLFQLLFASHF